MDLKSYNKEDIRNAREQCVVKANIMIQKARFELSTMEQKTILYVVSKIEPTDTYIKVYIFDVQDYCRVCGLDYNNGGNYAYVKTIIKGLRDKSLWVKLDDGSETLCSWVNKARINKRSGKIMIRLDDDIQEYLIGLIYRNNYTQYEILNILPMKSRYSIRIYELLKSHAFKEKKKINFDIDELKKQLTAENYQNFNNFRVKVLDIAVKEINEFTDLGVSYETEKKGKKVVKVIFKIKNCTTWEQVEKRYHVEDILSGFHNKKEDVPGQLNFNNCD
jgi:plasmid replication initiation protein